MNINKIIHDVKVNNGIKLKAKTIWLLEGSRKEVALHSYPFFQTLIHRYIDTNIHSQRGGGGAPLGLVPVCSQTAGQNGSESSSLSWRYSEGLTKRGHWNCVKYSIYGKKWPNPTQPQSLKPLEKSRHRLSWRFYVWLAYQYPSTWRREISALMCRERDKPERPFQKPFFLKRKVERIWRRPKLTNTLEDKCIRE